MSDDERAIVSSTALPDPVQPMVATAHWRIEVKPARFRAERIAYNALEETLRAAQIRLRGWYFPHLTTHPEQVVRGADYYGTWSVFTNYEYWRFYQSAFLFHLHGVREEVEESWRDKLAHASRVHLDWQKPDWDSVRGYFSIINFLYTVTEAFEFASRLSGMLKLDEPIEVSIHLVNIRGFILTAELDRSFDHLYQWNQPTLGRSWTMTAEIAREAADERAIEATTWFFQRFGWNNPSEQVLRAEQSALLKKHS